MIKDLLQHNAPWRFWQFYPEPPQEQWLEAINCAVDILELPRAPEDINDLLAMTLGEGRFGAAHWQLSAMERGYYLLKPLLPRPVINVLKRLHQKAKAGDFPLGWPVEDRYARFLWQVAGQAMQAGGLYMATFAHFWPHGHRYAFVLTHDVEMADGQAFAGRVADLEETLGFRSSFNFVPERYRLDEGLISDLRRRGFEIGVHGLKHDGRLFSSYRTFARRAPLINAHIEQLDAAGFRTPMTHRQPEWMQALNIEYDLSFFDTDPHEPMPGGTMSIWPFTLGRFVELPYTLVQDSTLLDVLKQQTPRLWLSKVDFVEHYCGMALLNSHPDYLRRPASLQVYRDFLIAMQDRGEYWHALPCEVARWWRARSESSPGQLAPAGVMATAVLDDSGLCISPGAAPASPAVSVSSGL